METFPCKCTEFRLLTSRTNRNVSTHFFVLHGEKEVLKEFPAILLLAIKYRYVEATLNSRWFFFVKNNTEFNCQTWNKNIFMISIKNANNKSLLFHNVLLAVVAVFTETASWTMLVVNTIMVSIKNENNISLLFHNVLWLLQLCSVKQHLEQ